MPGFFDWLREQGNVAPQEMARTFNCGIGMVVIIAKQDEAVALKLLKDLGETVWIAGTIRPRNGDEAQTQIL